MKQYDLTVVGAGIMGVMCAYFCHLRHPSWNILLVDKGLIGQGATRFSAGILGRFGSTEEKRNLARESLNFYKNISPAIQASFMFPVPLYWLFNDIEKIKDFQKFSGFDETLEETIPNFTDILCDIWLHDRRAVKDQQIYFMNVPLFIHSILCLLTQSNKFQLMEGCEILDLEKNQFNYLLKAHNFKIETKRVVICLGPWICNSFIKPYLDLYQIQIKLKKIVSFHIYEKPNRNSFGVALYGRDVFIIPFYDRGYWLYSFRCEEWAPDIHTLKFSLQVDDIKMACSLLSDIDPNIMKKNLGERIFCDAYSENFDPTIKNLDEGRLIFAGLGSGSGVRLAPGIAKRVVDNLID